MKLLPLALLTVLAFGSRPLHGATEPVPIKPVATPTRPINLDGKGPPIPSAPAAESSHPVSIPLWPEGAPGSKERRAEPEHVSWRQEPDIVFPVISNIHLPSLTAFLPAAANATGCAVIIAPGGGHMQLTIDREGYDLGRWLAEKGIAAFVLKYRLARDGSTPADKKQPYTIDGAAKADAQRAIRLVRSRAASWQVNPQRIGFLGFSAGGELALLAALQPDVGNPTARDAVDRVSSRPDFFAPIYSGGLQRTDLKPVKDQTPPAFLACAYDDRMPEQTANFFIALRQAGVNAELHIYSRGGHGFGVRSDRPDYAISTWQVRFVEWLNDRGFLQR